MSPGFRQDAHAETLAKMVVLGRAELRRACRILHDEVGSLLAVAGLRLQLLRLDHPEVTPLSGEIGEALESVMDRVRALSRELDPSPAGRIGLKGALLGLADKTAGALAGNVSVRCTTRAVVPAVIADAIYDATARVVSAAFARKGVTRVAISATGSKTLTVRVRDNGPRPRTGAYLNLAALLARQAGLVFEVITGKGTIVSIQYAIRRPAGR